MATFGKKTRNPGWVPGGHWVICDVCGFAIRGTDARKTWDDKVVCPEDFEHRNVQDFVRARPEDTSAKGLVRTEPVDVMVQGNARVTSTGERRMTSGKDIRLESN